MFKRKFIIILALLIALMPFLGFPYSFEKYFYLAGGGLIAVIVFLSRALYCKQCAERIKSTHKGRKASSDAPGSSAHPRTDSGVYGAETDRSFGDDIGSDNRDGA